MGGLPHNPCRGLHRDVQKCDMKTTASELLRALRAHRSQAQLARRLSYKSNPISDWEAGRRFPSAAETLRVASRTGVAVATAAERFHTLTDGQLPDEPSDQDVAAWLDALRGNTPVVELARRMDKSRYSIGRWLSGETRPRLPEFLKLIDVITGRMPDFVAVLVDISAVPSVEPRHRAMASAKRAAFEVPWLPLVLNMIESDTYRDGRSHDAVFMAHCLELTVPQVEQALLKLVEAAVISWGGHRYETVGGLSIDVADRAELNRLKRWWLDKARQRLGGQPRDGDLFSFNVFCVSREEMRRIRDLQRAYYREVRGVVADSEQAELIGLINLQLVTFELKKNHDGPDR
jgi:transcriptional regulator with XRE-family HTH domain